MAARNAEDELVGKMSHLSATDAADHGGDASGELSKPKKKKKAIVFDEPEEAGASTAAEPISAPSAARAEETVDASDAGADAKKSKKKKKAMTFGDDAEGEAEEAPAVVPPTAAAPTSQATSAGAGGLTDADRATGWVYTETPDEEEGLGEEEAPKSAAAPATTEASAAEESKREWCKCKYHENFEMLGEMVNSEGVPALEALGAKFGTWLAC
jgi:hypothetical protein